MTSSLYSCFLIVAAFSLQSVLSQAQNSCYQRCGQRYLRPQLPPPPPLPILNPSVSFTNQNTYGYGYQPSTAFVLPAPYPFGPNPFSAYPFPTLLSYPFPPPPPPFNGGYSCACDNQCKDRDDCCDDVSRCGFTSPTPEPTAPPSFVPPPGLSSTAPFVDSPNRHLTIEHLQVCSAPATIKGGYCEEYSMRTHEIAQHQTTNSVYVTQMKTSSLLQFRLDGTGKASPQYIRQNDIGALGGDSAVHYVMDSKHYPGHMWLTAQNSQEVFLINPQQNNKVVKRMVVPNQMPRPSDSPGNTTFVSIWSPHSLCEGPDGYIVVNLQNAPEIPKPASYIHERVTAKITEGAYFYAVWYIHPDKYDENAGYAKGGTVIPAKAQPVNCAKDSADRVIVCQDNSPEVLIVNKDLTSLQVSVSPNLKSGPGCVAAPDGSVFVGYIGATPTNQALPTKIVRFLPGMTTPRKISITDGTLVTSVPNSRRVIHYAFHPTKPIMYSLTTSLAANGLATNDIVSNVFNVNPTTGLYGSLRKDKTQVLPLGSFLDSHRICFVQHPQRNSIMVTLWKNDYVLQVFDDQNNFEPMTNGAL